MVTTEINGTIFEIDGEGFLSPTEELALEDWLHDMRVQDAAQKRFRSPETISTHRKNLREKTRQHSAAGVLAYCLSRGYIRLADKSQPPAFCRKLLLAPLFLAPLVGPIDFQFHRAQARIRTRKGVGVSLGQKVVALFSREPADDDYGIYDIPAYLRKQIAERDQANLDRAAQYAERVKAHIGAAA